MTHLIKLLEASHSHSPAPGSSRPNQAPSPRPHQRHDRSPMKLPNLLLLWLSALWPQFLALPLSSHNSLPQSFLLQSQEQMRKIQMDTEELQQRLCADYSLCHPEELILVGQYLGIPRPPLKNCYSQDLRLATCLNQLHYGLQLYKGLLKALQGISPELAPTLDILQLDVADFAATIWLQMEDLQVAPKIMPTLGTLPSFSSSFWRRAGGVLIFDRLQAFLETAYRALRHLSQA
ncbi:LOW QUALITY PROTEIN: granulocyte colony-stimulating factor [Gracilinanus agilis]|uniref:LOW QUALITY PROTEIN: granulocyte colony-stimulating factor n=1 Tax=Gracilinanus agilis TaxID=191870 RepID=UPI001CFE8E4C|nr:LOW QUALITY PROTEIN: granulocyte colony-stimulating factor [Gracilinanus agilis]